MRRPQSAGLAAPLQFDVHLASDVMEQDISAHIAKVGDPPSPPSGRIATDAKAMVEALFARIGGEDAASVQMTPVLVGRDSA